MNRIYQFIDKVGKRNFILIVFVVSIIVITGLYQTFSLFTGSEGVSILDGVKTFHFVLSENAENSLTIAAGSSKNVAITVSNEEEFRLKYGIYYSSSDDLTSVNLGYLSSSEHPGSGVIEGKKDYVVLMKIYNRSEQNVTIQIGIHYGMESGGDLVLEENQHWFEIIFPYLSEVEYLESDGTQYIDTKVAPSNLNIKVELQYQYISDLNTGDDSVIGARSNGAASARFYPSSIGVENGTVVDRHVYGAATSGDWRAGISTTHDYEKHTLVFNDESHNCYMDGTLVGNLNTIFTPHNQSMYLFGLNTEGNFTFQSASRVYYCKIWDNGTLVRDYIPVIDREGVPCLYDKVNDELYYNQNTEGNDFATSVTP